MDIEFLLASRVWQIPPKVLIKDPCPLSSFGFRVEDVRAGRRALTPAAAFLGSLEPRTIGIRIAAPGLRFYTYGL